MAKPATHWFKNMSIAVIFRFAASKHAGVHKRIRTSAVGDDFFKANFAPVLDEITVGNLKACFAFVMLLSLAGCLSATLTRNSNLHGVVWRGTWFGSVQPLMCLSALGAG